jgi:cytochrome c-type biogenesis protein CcmH/NrfG
MDRAEIESEHVVSRYLAGQLSDADETAFNEYARRHPEVFQDVELTLRMKEGLAVLRDRGELKPLLRDRHWRLSSTVAAASVVIVVALTLWTWLHVSHPQTAVLAGEAKQLLDRNAQPLPIV